MPSSSCPLERSCSSVLCLVSAGLCHSPALPPTSDTVTHLAAPKSKQLGAALQYKHVRTGAAVVYLNQSSRMGDGAGHGSWLSSSLRGQLCVLSAWLASSPPDPELGSPRTVLGPASSPGSSASHAHGRCGEFGAGSLTGSTRLTLRALLLQKPGQRLPAPV